MGELYLACMSSSKEVVSYAHDSVSNTEKTYIKKMNLNFKIWKQKLRTMSMTLIILIKLKTLKLFMQRKT